MTLTSLNFPRQLNWNLLRIFYEIASAKGVTAAAYRLSRKQSTISHALKRLEDELGSRLCIRGPSGFELTDEGQIVNKYCISIFKSIADIPNGLINIAEDIRGQLNFQFISNVVCPTLDEIFYEYYQLYPHVKINIDIVPWEGISRTVLRNEIDVGIAPVSTRYPELRYDYLFTENHRVYCGKNHFLFGKTIHDCSELTDENIILTGSDEPDQLTMFRQRHGIEHNIVGQSSHLEEAKRLTTIGAGICFLPEGLTEEEVRKGILWPVTNIIDDLALDIYVISHPQVPEHLTLKYFLNEVVKSAPKANAN